MGLDSNALTFLLAAQAVGASFDTTATIGRQQLFMNALDLRRTLGTAGLVTSVAEARNLVSGNGGYAEALLKRLGAQRVDSLDVSEYEGATYIHDLNLPIAADLEGKFSTVLDAGSLEHVFDIPTALRNCMAMVSDGGYLISVSPTNNLMGHGFYQFSPELLFTALRPSNGFEIKLMLIAKVGHHPDWRSVADPLVVGHRVGLISARPMYLYTLARRSGGVPQHLRLQQSDYEELWSDKANGDRRPSLAAEWKGRAPMFLREIWRRGAEVRAKRRNVRGLFPPFDIASLIRRATTTAQA